MTELKSDLLEAYLKACFCNPHHSNHHYFRTEFMPLIAPHIYGPAGCKIVDRIANRSYDGSSGNWICPFTESQMRRELV